MILKLLVILNSISDIWLHSVKKDLTNAGVHPIFTAIIPLICFHPFILAGLYFSGYWSLPTNIEFYLYFCSMCSLYLFGSYLLLNGLTKTNFASANAILSTNVVFQTILAVLILNEKVSSTGMLCFVVISLLLAKINFLDKFKFKADRGTLLVTAAVLAFAFTTIFFKKSSTLTSSFNQFLTGRTLVDFMFYSTSQLLLPMLSKKKISENYRYFFQTNLSSLYLLVFNLVATISTVLYFYLNVTTIVVLATIAYPVSFFIGMKKYQEKYEPVVIIENLIIVLAVIVFTLAG